MRHSLLPEADPYIKQNYRKSIWKKVLGCLSSAVVFLTVYVLILPAIALESQCELAEHAHSEDCYVQVASRQVKTLVCSYEALGVHTHTPECYSAENTLQCGLADFMVHTHDASCFDQTGAIACQLPEIQEHEHSNECYWMPEGESTEPELICTEAEIRLHSHSDGCFETQTDEGGAEYRILICSEPEVLAHTHTDACFTTSEEAVDTQSLTCGLAETEEHTHTAMCWGTWELACEIPEHTHSEECRPAAELTEEEQAHVDAVIAQIDKLESTEQVEEKLAAYEEAEDWEGYAAYQEEAAQKTQAVRNSYEALTDSQKLLVTNAAKLTQLDWLVPTSALDSGNQGTIREKLEGDWAYITDFKMKADDTTDSKTHLRTGTSEWDTDDAPGNDSSDLNNSLRTFDTATYTIQFNTKLRDAVAQQDVGGIRQGRLYFEFVLPFSAEKVQFETDTMGWLKSSQDIKYEVVTATVNGVESQVLRGSFTLVPTGSNTAAIGASTNELSVVIRALRMHNGDKVQPVFTLWLQHNEVGATYNAEDDRLPAAIVTGTNHICGAEETKKDGTVETHDTCEAATLYGTEITISARGMFNIAVTGVDNRNTKVGTYNFDETTYTNAINYGLGKVKGRLNGYGLRIELRGKSGQGMRGAEFPDENTPITFEITISSAFDPTNGAKASEPNYLAQFWSGAGNKAGNYTNSVNERSINSEKSLIMTVPYNDYASSGRYNHCYDGGTWSFAKIEGTDNKLKVTVSGFEFNTEHFPYYTPAGNWNSYTFYNPNTISNYWEISQAVFSVGELWVIQPYYGLTGDDTGIYIADKHDAEGQFYTRVEISNLYMKTESGTEITQQAEPSSSTSDNFKEAGQYLLRPGTINAQIIYLKSESRTYNEALTDGGYTTDTDWATAGSGVTLESYISHDGAEGEFVGVAYNNLIKFDDEFFLPDTDSQNYGISGITTEYQLFWAALPDGNGWTDDEHMKSATEDDLVFYSSLADLYADNKVAVGVLIEVRGVVKEAGLNHLHLYIDGAIRSDCAGGKVYMMTRTTYAWHKQDVAEEALAYHNKKYPDAQYETVDELTNADYNEYVQDSENGFPSHSNSSVKLLSDDKKKVEGDYPAPFFRQDYYYTSATTVKTDGTTNSISSTSALKKASKPSYDSGTYTAGYGAPYYQDSCLVVPHTASITKATAQREKEATTSKKVYDIGQNQRTVDYVLNAKIDRVFGENASSGAELTTTVYIEDTLPASLTYLEGSAYYGGTYTQDPLHQNQGTCTGVNFESTSNAGTNAPTAQHPYLESITRNADGTTTIRWMFDVHMDVNTATWTAPIYFSCSIGTPGVEETDVKNGDSIDNTVKIWTSGDRFRPFEKEYGNLDTYGITILKTSAVSLSEVSDHLVLDWWEDFGFTKNVGNNSGNIKNDTIIVNTLPFNGILRSDFTGRLVVTEFSASLVGENGSPIESDFQFYYTTSQSYAGKLSSDYYAELNSAALTVAEWLTQEVQTGTVWHPLTDGLPSVETQQEWDTYTNEQITAIIAVGDLPAYATLKMHITVKLPDGSQGDYLVSYLSQESLSSYARAQAVNRSLEGLTWLDWNANGTQDSGEERISGVKVSLLHLVDGEYVPYCYPKTATPITIETGQMISVQAAEGTQPTAYDTGRYKFTGLPAGTYAVKFESGSESESITKLFASPVNNTSDDTLDSDGVPTYSEDSAGLSYTWIEGIVMKPATELVYGTDESKYHDSGFYPKRYELPETGGSGTAAYPLAGVLLCSAACLLYIQNRRKERNAFCS